MYFKVTRPVGLKERPVPLKDVKKEGYLTSANLNIPRRIWDFYVDGTARKARVRKIQKEMAYGGMYDIHVYNKTKGRLFAGPVSYFKRDKSLFFPNFGVSTLTGQEREIMDLFGDAKATVLRVFSTATGTKMTEDYFKIPDSQDSYLTKEGLKQFQQTYPEAQLAELVLSDTWLKGIVYQKLSTGKRRKDVPEPLWESYVTAIQEEVLDREVREKLLMTNHYAGYVYVIDNDCKVRWVGSGLPTPEEIKGLWKAVRGVSREATSRKQRGTSESESSEN